MTAKIKIKDLPKDMKISQDEMKNVTGGDYSYCAKYVIPAPALGKRKAAEIHSAARAQEQLLDSVLSGIGADIANGQTPM